MDFNALIFQCPYWFLVPYLQSGLYTNTLATSTLPKPRRQSGRCRHQKRRGRSETALQKGADIHPRIHFNDTDLCHFRLHKKTKVRTQKRRSRSCSSTAQRTYHNSNKETWHTSNRLVSRDNIPADRWQVSLHRLSHMLGRVQRRRGFSNAAYLRPRLPQALHLPLDGHHKLVLPWLPPWLWACVW